MRVSIAILAALTLVPTAAVAGDKKAEQKDPNRVVCEKQEVVGSRLATKRICMTVAEWEAKRLEDRQAIDKAQTGVKAMSGN